MTDAPASLIWPRALPLGPEALSVELGDRIDAGVNDRVIALARSLAETPVVGIRETVPTYRALLVRYDPAAIRGRALEARLLDRLAGLPAAAAPGRLWRIPVAYGGEAGMDLEALAELKGMAPEDLIARHLAPEYRVYMIGFAPGFAYLGGLPEALHTPRLPQPRQRIPAGAIGIGGQQASINSVPGPSGWRYIAGTPVRLFDPGRDPAVLLAAGDRVRFERVTPSEAARMAVAGFLPEPAC